MVQILKNKKVKVIICLMIILIMLVLTMKQSYAAGDVSSVIQQAWKQMESQIKNIVNNVVFPVIDIILAVLCEKSACFAGVSFSLLNLQWHILITENKDSLIGQHQQYCLRV